MKSKLEKKIKTVEPKWAEAPGKWWIFKPKFKSVAYICGKCEEINETIIPVKEGEFRTSCMYCKTINKMDMVINRYSIFE